MKLVKEQHIRLDPTLVNCDRVLPSAPGFRKARNLLRMVQELEEVGLYAPDTTTDLSQLPMDEELKTLKINGVRNHHSLPTPLPRASQKRILYKSALLKPPPVASVPFNKRQLRYLMRQLEKVESPPTPEQVNFLSLQLKVVFSLSCIFSSII